MTEADDRVTVVGVGGIGCALGHALCLAGAEVTFVDADGAKVEWGQSHGVVVDEAPPQAATFVPFERWRPADRELVLLCTKCYDNRAVLERLTSAVELVPVQNGFDRELLGRVRVEGIASFVSECTPGRTHTRITRAGELHVGFREGSPEAAGRPLPAAVESLVRRLEAQGRFAVRRVPEVLPYKYTKLMYNAAISPLAALAGLDNGELLTLGRARSLFFRLLRENYRVLKRAEAPLERIGPLHPDNVDRILRLPLVARLLAFPFARTLRGSYCSMAGDLPRGRTEIDNYNGHLLELAVDLEMPLNRAVYALVKRAERDLLPPDLRWLDELP